jgi:hypothetical protein
MLLITFVGDGDGEAHPPAIQANVTNNPIRA